MVIAPLFPIRFVEAGTQTFSTAGTYSFTVPTYGTLTVEVWGGGGAGGDPSPSGTANYTEQTGGTASSFNGTVVANGGAKGIDDLNSSNGTFTSGGAGGTASGGDTNSTGGNGASGTPDIYGGDGGNAPNGGVGGSGGVIDTGIGTLPEGGSAPGGGGGAFGFGYSYSGYNGAFAPGGGGSGGYSTKTYSSGSLTVGASVTIIVGAGGIPGTLISGSTPNPYGGAGAPGRVSITWTDAPTDTDPPTPDPMTFATNPNDTSTSTISMTAITATDADGADPVEYLFSYAACASDAGTGGTSSSWQTSTSYVDSGLQANHCYGYTISARDALGNSTATSSAFETYSAASVPGTPNLAAIGETKMIIQNNENGNPSSSPATFFALQVSSTTPTDATWDGKYIDAAGDPSDTAVWLPDSSWDDLLVTGLSPGTEYSLIAKAKNGDGDETAWSGSAYRTTLESVTRTVRLLGNILLLGGVRLQ